MAYKQELWDEAKKKCRIPKSLIKNIPNKKEMWKAPVKDWIHDMYEKGRRKRSRKQREKITGNSQHLSQ